MTIAAGLLHGLDLLATGLLTGALVYSRMVGRERDYGFLRRLAAPALAASILWAFCATCGMCDSYGPGELWRALAGTSFGLYAGLKLGVLAALLASLRLRKFAPAFWLGLALPLFSGLTGHAGAETAAPALSLGLDYAHFLAVAIWSGGLLSLAASLRARLAEKGADFSGTPATVRRFSRAALAAVAVIAATGVWTAGRAGVSWRTPWETDYGRLVLLKTFFFCVALGGASVNRFRHMRAPGADDGKRLARSMLGALRFELSAVLLAFLAAGFLTGAALPGE